MNGAGEAVRLSASQLIAFLNSLQLGDLDSLRARLVEAEGARRTFVGRTSQQAPEIDGVVRVRGACAPGDLVRVRITGADTYDLEGEICASNIDTAGPTP